MPSTIAASTKPAITTLRRLDKNAAIGPPQDYESDSGVYPTFPRNQPSSLKSELLRPDRLEPGEHHQPGHHDRREERGDDAEAQRHGEAADGARPQLEEDGGGDQMGHVGVEDGRPGALEALVDRSNDAAPVSHLFPDALIDQDVGVDGHAHGEHDARDARQRQ